MVTVEVMVTSVGDELRLTVAPLLPAAALIATVQVDTAGAISETGLQVKPFRAGVCAMVTTPPVAEADIAAAVGLAAEGLETWTAEEVCSVDDNTFSATVATTPLGTVPEPSPHSMQCKVPVWLSHETDLLAWVAAGPAVTFADEKSDEE
jgi:hypothetical protein